MGGTTQRDETQLNLVTAFSQANFYRQRILLTDDDRVTI